LETLKLKEWYDKIANASSLKEIEEMGIIKIDMAKKLIYKGKIEVVKIGSKLHLSRTELIRYLESNTIPPLADY